MLSEDRMREAADALEKIARVPTLQGGVVRFGPDLSGGEWYPDAADAFDRTSWPCIVVGVPEHSDSYDVPGRP